MAAISDILLAIKNLSHTELQAFSDTAKKCVDEASAKKLDEIPTVSLDDEASPISVSQTFPLIYISNDDLVKAEKFDPKKYDDVSNPIIANGFHCGSKVSLLFQGGTKQLQIMSTFPDEKPVFIYMRSGQHHAGGMNQPQTFSGRYFTITNYGNIFSSYRNVSHYSNNGYNPELAFPSTEKPLLKGQPQYVSTGGKSYPIEVVSDHLLDIDEFCRVPQIFIDVITVTTRLFESTALPAGGGFNNIERPHNKEKHLKERFKVLCRQYYKARLETKSELDDIEKERISHDEQLKEQQSAIKTFQDEAANQRAVIETQQDELKACRDENINYCELLKQQRELIRTQQDELERQRELIQAQQDELDRQRKLNENLEKPQQSSWKPW